jgi:hypothetical protein
LLSCLLRARSTFAISGGHPHFVILGQAQRSVARPGDPCRGAGRGLGRCRMACPFWTVGALPECNGMDPSVYAQSLRSWLRPRMTKRRGASACTPTDLARLPSERRARRSRLAATTTALSSSSGKRSGAERDPEIHAVTSSVERDGAEGCAVRDRGALPECNGMDPRVCAASLRSWLRPRMTKRWGDPSNDQASTYSARLTGAGTGRPSSRSPSM